ncbi:cbb3-type cytochrome c oxidase ccoP subunit III [Blattabacterium sp. (Blattella germanica) str. Bge]|uniref:cbb3-type cytochrome c oxidase N-terminal domain-containing protein n=1 Tax=Blattabacterium sp. (Blattella germanica) TaxID=624186 RepID=UPI0001BB61DC|nr:cbb3-type cytochrome c oxidase N-terminal domain-containing protein [Blattabacterium sp. (Blattella germanica)]ACY40422.1 cbb3-type cytochrome c oxidase ccoP subunit III [Blattabacterium sp. (Blattella germanica) str. Bge]
MRSRIPSFIMIPSFLSIIIFMFYVFFRSYNHIYYLVHPITISFLIVTTILLWILEFVNSLIFRKKLQSIEEKERIKIFEENEGNYFYRLYKFIFHDPKKMNDGVKKIDHGFDGIIELDNRLPMWWIHLFYMTIIFSAIYFFSYLFMDFSNPYKEYEIAYKNQLKQIEIFEKNTPQVTIENACFKENLIDSGKTLFDENCATCHQSDGSGNIGPNLTDDYWINTKEKNLFKNIFSIIWNGSDNNPTMRAFGKSGEIKGNDIEKISSYVYFINQKSKKPLTSKAPQGKKITEWSKI